MNKKNIISLFVSLFVVLFCIYIYLDYKDKSKYNISTNYNFTHGSKKVYKYLKKNGVDCRLDSGGDILLNAKALQIVDDMVYNEFVSKNRDEVLVNDEKVIDLFEQSLKDKKIVYNIETVKHGAIVSWDKNDSPIVSEIMKSISEQLIK